MTTEPIPEEASAFDLEAAIQTRLVHGHQRAYVDVGTGPALLLIHGLGGSIATWDRVIPRLARRFRVIAPDLLGHGRSAKPRADYSVGGYANGMRDLLSILGVDRVTVVGHSFGGGVAMQFAYQYPERCERVVLVGTGGLGREVSPFLRALTVPGTGRLLALVAQAPVRQLASVSMKAVRTLPVLGVVPGLRDLPEMLDGFDALRDGASRSAFLHVLRAAVDPAGQVVTMIDRSYLAEAMPVLIVWGKEDSVIPVAHGRRGAEVLPGSRLVVLDRAGHFPHRDRPDTFVAVLDEFLDTTEPARHRNADFRALLRSGGIRPV